MRWNPKKIAAGLNTSPSLFWCTCGGGSRSGRATSYLGKVTGVATRAQSIAKVQASSLRKVTPPSLRFIPHCGGRIYSCGIPLSS
jgi:hypothetical protein